MKATDRKFAVELARRRYVDRNVEIDDFPTVREADGGAWIAAWVWAPTVPKRGAAAGGNGIKIELSPATVNVWNEARTEIARRRGEP